jgi:hypothetical protein
MFPVAPAGAPVTRAGPFEEDYFGSIPHADLQKSVARRIVDRRVLHLI